MIRTLLVLAITLASFHSFSQTLPKASPLGKSTQIVGATEISLEYSRPGVKGRTIFGGLLPYGELWRMGANSSTKFITQDDLIFGDKILAAGSYALFAIPNANGDWEIAFNTDTEQSGTYNYSEEKDALRLVAKAQINSFTETLTLTIDKITDTSASLVLLWENLRVELPFEVNTKAVAIKNIEEAIKGGKELDAVYYNAANYYYGSLNAYDKALSYVDQSLDLKESYRALFLKARILEKQGNKTEAIQLAEKSHALAKEGGSPGFTNYIASTLESWKK